ncbi:tetratricopeptide repeat protein 4 [Genypterus blacodes]|uniref:tetratricopeptide repeat protein 4 n=1 Tax=Genypterus blacodes TaxID=154954 RepID=UPI003F75BC87
MALDSDSDDGMDAFMDKFKAERYKKALNEDNWEEELDRIPLFMKSIPDEIDPMKYPDLACLQAIIHDDDRTPEEQVRNLKDEANEYFKEKSYEKAVLVYTAALKRNYEKNGDDKDTNMVLFTNRAAAQFHLGNIRSALKDAAIARKLKPDHLKALMRGAQCCVELRQFAEALWWCDEGLKVHPTDKKLQELRAAADKQKRAAERDARKSKVKEKKLLGEKKALLAAIQERGVKLHQPDKPQHGSDSEDEDGGSSVAMAVLSLDALITQEATGARVFLDEQGVLHWPVLLLYPEHQQTDFISAFCENSCFLDHLAVMFGEELPPWDTDRKYLPQNLQVFFEDAAERLYQVNPETSLLEVLQHKRFLVKAGSPSFFVLVEGSAFRVAFLKGRRLM